MKKYDVWRKLWGIVLCVCMVLSWVPVPAFANGTDFDGDLPVMEEEVPEDPQCYCVEKCTDVNEWCDVCGFDYTACAGEGEATSYALAQDGNGVYQIATAEELFAFARLVNRGQTDIDAILIANIDLAYRSWTPIGNDYNQYTGTFDGAGYTISGLSCINSMLYTGLFGYVGGTVKNVTLSGSYFKSSSNYVGSVAGYNMGTISGCINEVYVSGGELVGGIVGLNVGTVSNCINNDDVTGSGDHVGGVVGASVGTISNCSNSGDITGGGDNSGGVVGSLQKGTASNCSNRGDVIGSGSYTGGVVGCSQFDSNVKITDCDNSGTITGKENMVGGIVGFSVGGISGCCNTGKVTGSGDYVGGVIGGNQGTVQDCTNKAAVKGSREVGGVAGLNGDTVIGCTNEGSVKGRSKIGGVVGATGATVINCTNKGKVNGTEHFIGGVLGLNDGGTVSRCCNIGSVTDAGNNEVGGVLGWNEGTVSDCYNTGDINGNDFTSAGGVVGWNAHNGTVKNCYSIGTVSGTSEETGGAAGKNAGILTNCYYLDTCGATGSGTSKSEEAFASGEVTYLLNGGVTYGIQVWYQTIGTDSIPQFTGSVVYRGTDCMGNVAYANTQQEDGYHAAVHTYKVNAKDATCTENGSFDTVVYCTVCEEKISCETTTVPALGHEFKDGSCTVCGQEDTIAKIEIAAGPIKTECNLGEELDTTGVTIRVSYTNGGYKEITEGFQITGFDPQKAGKQTITVTYEGMTTTFTVTVKGDFLWGDANGDGLIDFSDAVLVLEYSAFLIDDTQVDLSACDVNGDGVVDFSDAVLILEYSAFLITEFPAAKK